MKTGLIVTRRFVLVNFLVREHKGFIFFTAMLFFIAGSVYTNPRIAMWFAFAVAAYASIANDSIQTLGTFISSTKKVPWAYLWLYVAFIFLAVAIIGWYWYGGDVSHQRLAFRGFSETPLEFHFLQIAAPIFLLILTRFRMPVSTTFLLLGSFTNESGVLFDVLDKSLLAYLLAFVFALSSRLLLDKFIVKNIQGQSHRLWAVLQWTTTGVLWALWLVQDIANFSVYLPRKLGVIELISFLAVVVVAIGILFFKRGDSIQEVVEEKTDVDDIRVATLIDMGMVLILIIFTFVSPTPMSTTWAFLGLLGGRELGIKLVRKDDFENTWNLIGKDILYALGGLIFSIIIAATVNDIVRRELLLLLGIMP